MTIKTNAPIRNDCGECGMSMSAGPEYHPYWFCLLFKRGYDPRDMAEDFRKALRYVESR